MNNSVWLPYPHLIAFRISALVTRSIEGFVLTTCASAVAPPWKSSSAAVSALPRKRNLLFPARGLPVGSAVPFLLLALRHGMGFLSLFAKYLSATPSSFSLLSRPSCLTEAGLGVFRVGSSMFV